MLNRKAKEQLSEQKNPDDPEEEECAPGSIEQQLDMCESGSLRGDTAIREFSPSREEDLEEYKELTEELMNQNYHLDLSETNREGDEMSGDEHSFGLQGEESEHTSQRNEDTDLPGGQTKNQ